MKKIFKPLVVAILGWQVKQLCRKNRLRIIAVVGSMGKTSTKLAIANVLSEQYSVQYQNGNYNDLVSVPLVFFGQSLPSLRNPFAWMKALLINELKILRHYPYEIVVIELGTDGPGQLAQFKRYLKIDLLVVTAIAPEHMEFFKDLGTIAKEELAPQAFSKDVLINKDLCPEYYSALFKQGYQTYGIKSPADYRIRILSFKEQEFDLEIFVYNTLFLNTKYHGISEVELYSMCAAVAAAERTSMPTDNILRAIQRLKAVSGRMQQLDGIKQSLIIDDTYNASPEATKFALDALYKLKAPQKIAVLGTMNELGAYSEPAHTEIGEYCDPSELSLIVTIGQDANNYLATAAKKRGCNIKTFNNPFDAGLFVRNAIKTKAAVLVKGSQNGVFAEEVIKYLLEDPRDEQRLVRQSPEWLRKKARLFQEAGNIS